MVLVDFTLAERWRIFGELSLRSVQGSAAESTFRRTVATVQAVSASVPQGRDMVAAVQPHDQPARRQAEAMLMQRLL